MRHARFGLLLLCTAGVAAPLAAAAAGPPADACGLLTLEEVKATTGRQDLRNPRSEPQPGGASECRYEGWIHGSLNVVLSPSTKKSFDDFRALLEQEGKKPEKVEGLGDAAYYWDDRIHVRAGDRSLTVWNGEPHDQARTWVTALARAAVAKLGR